MSDMSFEVENVSHTQPQSTHQFGQLAVHSENIASNSQMDSQMAKNPTIPVLNRPHPVLDWVKTRKPLVPRVKLIGTFNIVDPSDFNAQRYGARSAGGEYNRERRLPQPYPYTKFVWDPTKDIARLPSVAVIGSHPTPPTRQLSPEKISVQI
jgi:hypothetical protein